MKIINKKGLYNFAILESIEAGIALTGAEVKSVKEGRIDLSKSFARILGSEVFLLNANIPSYQNTPIKGYDPIRSRKLLLHKGQIQSLVGELSKGRLTLVPVAVYEKNNLIKVQLGIARSKKAVDRREEIKERDQIRRIEQELRGKE